MADVAKLFDDHILDRSKESVDLNDEEYKGKVIGLYFSAHCSDNDEESFNEYYEHMPWLTLDFKESDKKAEIENKFDITGIPTLILLDRDSGDIIYTDADERISLDDSEGEKFPWKSS
ncbi:unnamed protein product [Rotaria sordida]|uniref:Thioredoxin-like fold domain-containing protein n=1 Tax=Rotaria sordida TaxID=392033 RepID=A0A819JIP4_9BILA|nr:unnamed protein product [Rotaria sordida]CAF3934120.1 unnamed protein product [Rotaria sordida]